MAKRKAATRAASRRPAKKRAPARAAKRPSPKRAAQRPAGSRKAAPPPKNRKKAAAPAAAARKAKKPAVAKRRSTPPPPQRVAQLNRARRTLGEPHGVPSSLDMDQHASAAATGRAEMDQSLREHHGMEGISGGDVDVNIEDAYFTGDEAPGGDNPTPDQDIVEEIGEALGVVYEDNEPMKGGDKVVERDRHRWELDPASAEDFKDRE